MSKPSSMMSLMSMLAQHLPPELLQKIMDMQDEYETAFRERTFEESIGDMVTVTVDGVGKVLAVTIGEKYLAPQFSEVLSDTIPITIEKAVETMNREYQRGVQEYFPKIRAIVQQNAAGFEHEDFQDDDVFNIVKKKKDEDLH